MWLSFDQILLRIRSPRWCGVQMVRLCTLMEHPNFEVFKEIWKVRRLHCYRGRFTGRGKGSLITPYVLISSNPMYSNYKKIKKEENGLLPWHPNSRHRNIDVTYINKESWKKLTSQETSADENHDSVNYWSYGLCMKLNNKLWNFETFMHVHSLSPDWMLV